MDLRDGAFKMLLVWSGIRARGIYGGVRGGSCEESTVGQRFCGGGGRRERATCDDWRRAREELARVRCSQTVSNSKATLKYRHGLRTILVGMFYYDY